ncbi:hypothetical protein [Rhodoblastus sp.]|jgi:hypothetical protein|uniref:hypothetical protein n=1 Tax=Rhodoblastus sp. TaxID=1962975 RepID=UPI0025FEF622|nr:hypothetical protein [Rhodoblastus sp.]
MTTKTRHRPQRRPKKPRQFLAERGERLSLRLPEGLLAAVDAWADAHEGQKPDRGEAIRGLLQAGLLAARTEQHRGWAVTDKYVPCNALDRGTLQQWHRSSRLALPERELQRLIQLLSLYGSGQWSFLEVDRASWEPHVGHPGYVFLFENQPDLELLKL